jgi:predicted aldo/keto reductase-like oxidoreductase
MEYRTLGRTGLRVSALGMGTIQITRLPWKESIDVVRRVMDMGINWFDTARGYFDSELRLGEAFKGLRDRVILISKSTARTPEELKTHIDESLSRLQTDYIDFFLFHGSGALEEGCFFGEGGLLDAAVRAVDAGKIRFLGFSAHGMNLAMRALEVDQFLISMIPANFISREYIDGEFMRRAAERDIAVLAMKPFGGGRIINPGVCLRFLKGYPDLFPCIGIENPEEMAQNIAIWDRSAGLSEQDREEMKRIRDLLGSRFCRGCRYCLPCPEGIPIQTVTFLQVFAKQMPRERVLTDRHREAVELARECNGCRQCVEKCPYDLEIPAMLEENIRFYEEFSSQAGQNRSH